jgi:hypothetical protein
MWNEIENIHRINAREERLDQNLIRARRGLLEVLDHDIRSAGASDSDALHIEYRWVYELLQDNKARPLSLSFRKTELSIYEATT